MNGAVRLAAVAAALAVGNAGCVAEYDHTEISGVRPSKLPTEPRGKVDRSRIEVPAGMIVTAHIVSYNDDKNIMSMNVRARDSQILDVSNVISDHDFAFIGVKPGVTEVDILAGGKVVLIISAIVLPQPPEP